VGQRDYLTMNVRRNYTFYTAHTSKATSSHQCVCNQGGGGSKNVFGEGGGIGLDDEQSRLEREWSEKGVYILGWSCLVLMIH